VTIDLGQSVVPVAEPVVRVTLAAGLLKGDQMDAVVRDATMLGVHAIVPMTTAHVAVPERAWKDSQAIERWHRVAVASAKQCRRAVVPVIHPVTPFARVVGADGPVGSPGHEAPAGPSGPTARLIFVEPAVGGAGAIPPCPHDTETATLLLGPEGGWSSEEVARAVGAGFALVRLGPRTLRAERAPIVALSALWAVWGW
jgi:16S rRNA (uracil1498-N3)-methyltransferase